ncbi:MAG: glucosyltransferase domain-containing protein [Lachnospiraceae bacterium]|nr:glucosyltransferase domain-containing protein [Lachnospiraceae bacterium]
MRQEKDKENATDNSMLKRALLYTYILGLMAHGFGLLNLNLSHDALYNFYSGISAHEWQISLGRVLEPVYREITASTTIMPWSMGIFAFLWIGLTVYLTCRMFQIDHSVAIFLLAGIMVVNCTVTALIATYLPWFGADAMALLLAVAGAYCWYLWTSKQTGASHVLILLGGSICIACSLALYQSYIAVTVVVIILLSIRHLLQRVPIPQVLHQGLCSVGMIGFGGAVYYIMVKAVCCVVGIDLAAGKYDSVTNFWDNPEPIAYRVWYCIKEELKYFFSTNENAYPYRVIWFVNGMLLMLCVGLGIILIRQRKLDIVQKAVLLLLCTSLPLAANLMRLLNNSVHDLMVYAIWMLYLLPILFYQWLASSKTHREIRYILCGLMFFIVISNIQTANMVYIKKDIEDKATLALMTETMTQVDQLADYVPGKTEVIFVGYMPNIVKKVPGTDRVDGITGAGKAAAITYEETYEAYFKNVMLRDVNLSFQADVIDSKEIKEMPAYPQKGYVRMIEDKVVVKLE